MRLVMSSLSTQQRSSWLEILYFKGVRASSRKCSPRNGISTSNHELQTLSTMNIGVLTMYIVGEMIADCNSVQGDSNGRYYSCHLPTTEPLPPDILKGGTWYCLFVIERDADVRKSNTPGAYLRQQLTASSSRSCMLARAS